MAFVPRLSNIHPILGRSSCAANGDVSVSFSRVYLAGRGLSASEKTAATFITAVINSATVRAISFCLGRDKVFVSVNSVVAFVCSHPNSISAERIQQVAVIVAQLSGHRQAKQETTVSETAPAALVTASICPRRCFTTTIYAHSTIVVV